jgi:hypothetical protein
MLQALDDAEFRQMYRDPLLTKKIEVPRPRRREASSVLRHF